MSNKIVVLSEYRRAREAHVPEPEPWVEIFSADGMCSTLQVYSNPSEREVEIVQLNDDDESIRTLLSTDEAHELLLALQNLGLKHKTDKEKS